MKIADIINQAKELEERVKREGATERDVLFARELVNKYIDELERLENNVKVDPPLLTSDDIANKILERWYG